MDDGSRLPWIIAIVMVFCAAWCAMTETAFSSASRNKIKIALDRGDARAKKTMYVLDNFESAISTILILTNITHISAASLVTLAVTRAWGISFVSVSTVVTTIVVFFAGEMLPKSIAKRHSEKLAYSGAGLMCFFMKLLSPFSAFLSGIGRLVLDKTGGDTEVSVTEDELYDIIEDLTEEGALDSEQGELISSALQFADVTVESIATPRVDIMGVSISEDVKNILKIVKATNHSRLPVYDGSIDNIVGILPIRRFIKGWLEKGEDLDISELVDKPFYVHGSSNIDELLSAMTQKRFSLAVVTDNYGGTLGIVTVEDILEELVGEIWDEDDVIHEIVAPMPDGSFLVDADETVSDCFEGIGFEDPEGDEELVNTLMSEWIYSQFPVIPSVGSCFEYHGLRVSVAAMRHNRILRLKVELPETEEGGEAQ